MSLFNEVSECILLLLVFDRLDLVGIIEQLELLAVRVVGMLVILRLLSCIFSFRGCRLCCARGCRLFSRLDLCSLWTLLFLSASDLLELVIFYDTLINVRLSQFGSLVDAVCESTEVAVSAFACILLINKNVLVVHPIVVVFETHDTTLKWCILVHGLLNLRVHIDLRHHWLRWLS